MTRNLTLPLLLAVAGIYLFASAPPPLPDEDQAGRMQDAAIHVKVLLDAANAANAAARKIYTERIVTAGQEAGLAFDEDWRKPDREAGPLPALFLRAVAESLQQQSSALALFLGSDNPINPSNAFTGDQVAAFAALRQDRRARYFPMPDLGRQVALYADVAVAAGCVKCHNEHPKTPKRDWVRGDVMGATTWTYPAAVLNEHELRTALAQVYAAIDQAYRTYLEKARRFADPPVIGSEWPRKGHRRLPDAQTFMAAVKEASALSVLNGAVLLQ
jgi:hypothetical protein